LKLAKMELAERRGELIEKRLVERQAAYLLVALRQKIMQLSATYARRILNVSDVEKARKILTTAAHQLLGELQDLPEKVTDPGWLKELEADGSKRSALTKALDVNEFARGVTSLLIPAAGAAAAIWSCCLRAALSFRRLSTVASNSEIRAGRDSSSSRIRRFLETSAIG
jgi:hypothetical protein